MSMRSQQSVLVGELVTTLHEKVICGSDDSILREELTIFLFVKGQAVNTLCFVGHTVFVATTHLCPCSAKADIGHTHTRE